MASESRPPPVAVGEVLAGKYRVERVIGEGGMGVVVAATHLQLDAPVALKFILHDNGQSVARFLREARNAVRLKSEHVARVSDVGTLDSGMPYMVMEYLEGRDLFTVLEASGPLPVSDAVGYVVQACEAVAEAHALGIVHRDIKPHNLFLTSGVGGRPKVKVLDFGISKATGAELALTRSMEIIGTPNYMAPEQLRSSRDVDLRADVWAIGVVLYELLTGRLPFEAETLAQLCTMVLSDPPVPPSSHRPDLPPALEEAILRCLQRAPGDRFADVGELVSALAPFSPDWASPKSVLDVPRSQAGGSGRSILPASVPARSDTGAAWSDTELAGRPRPRWKTPALIALAVFAGGGILYTVRASPGRADGAIPPAAATTGPATSSAPEPPREASMPPAETTTVQAPAPALSPAPAPPGPAPAASSAPHADARPTHRSHAKTPSTSPSPSAAPAPAPASEEDEMNHR